MPIGPYGVLGKVPTWDTNLIASVLSGSDKFRVYFDDGNYYVFRDKFIGDGITKPQYGVLDVGKTDFSVVWHDCGNDRTFSACKPFAQAGMHYMTDGHSTPDVILRQEWGN